MKRLTAILLAIVLTVFAPIAQAADIVRPVLKAAPPAPVPTYNWTGLYVGAHAGWGFAHNRFRDAGSGIDSADFFADGGLAGGQIGYNWQFGAWLLGVEAEGS